MIDDEQYINLINAEQCQSCLFERALCLQNDECLLSIEEQMKKKNSTNDDD